MTRLGRPLGRGGADQLDPGLQELARLAALRANPAVAVGVVGEAQRQLRGGVAGADDARDRDRHVRAQHQDLAVLVEDAVGGPDAVERAATEHRLVLERGRGDLAVAGGVERRAHRLDDRAQLAHLVGQHVACPAGDRNDHRAHGSEPDGAGSASGSPGAGRLRRLRRRAHGHARGRALPGIGAAH